VCGWGTWIEMARWVMEMLKWMVVDRWWHECVELLEQREERREEQRTKD
jgi:hypothetical protein